MIVDGKAAGLPREVICRRVLLSAGVELSQHRVHVPFLTMSMEGFKFANPDTAL